MKVINDIVGYNNLKIVQDTQMFNFLTFTTKTHSTPTCQQMSLNTYLFSLSYEIILSFLN